MVVLATLALGAALAAVVWCIRFMYSPVADRGELVGTTRPRHGHDGRAALPVPGGRELPAAAETAILRLTHGERIDAVAPILTGGFLVVTDQHTLIIDDRRVTERIPHAWLRRARASHNSSHGLVSIAPQEPDELIRADTVLSGSRPVPASGTCPCPQDDHGRAVDCRVASAEIAGAMRDAVQELVTALQHPLPVLFPDYYLGILQELGKPGTDQNVLALIEYVSQMFSINAIIWLTDEGRRPELWFEQFSASRIPQERWPHLVDDMFRFFWDRDWRYRKAVAAYPETARSTVLDPDGQVHKYGDHLPFGMWGDAPP